MGHLRGARAIILRLAAGFLAATATATTARAQPILESVDSIE